VNAKANTRRGGCLACHAPECVITMLRLQNGLISRILLYYFRTKNHSLHQAQLFQPILAG
jgi:hypothetical protein